MTYLEEWEIMKSHLDQALKKLSYEKAKKDGVRCNSCWTSIEASGRIIIPEDDLQIIKKHQTGASWVSCQANLESLIASGHAGLAIGGNPHRTLQQSKLEAIIDDVIQEIKGKGITKDLEISLFKTCQENYKEHDIYPQLMHPPKTCKVVYMDVEYMTTTSSPMETLNFKWFAHVYTHAAALCNNPTLWCEKH